MGGMHGDMEIYQKWYDEGSEVERAMTRNQVRSARSNYENSGLTACRGQRTSLLHYHLFGKVC